MGLDHNPAEAGGYCLDRSFIKNVLPRGRFFLAILYQFSPPSSARGSLRKYEYPISILRKRKSKGVDNDKGPPYEGASQCGDENYETKSI